MTYPYNAIPSNNPQNITLASPVQIIKAQRVPTAQDNTYPSGTYWQNLVSGQFYICRSSTIAGAVWDPFAPAGAGNLDTLTADSGGAVGPDGLGNINILGDGTTISVIGNPGTNTLTISLKGGSAAIEQVNGNSGSVTPTLGAISIVGASGISTSGSGSTLTIVATGGGFTWTDVTTSTQTIVVENGYVTNRGGGVTYTLPATAVEGNIFHIAGKSGIWTIAQNANQIIHVGSGSTTTGVTGSVVANNAGDCGQFLCIVGGASTEWRSLSVVGTLTLN